MKLTLISFLIFFISSLSCVDLTVEKVGETALIHLKIESQKLISKDGLVDYKAIFEVFDSDDKSVFQIKKEIKYNDSAINDEIISIFAEAELHSASYTGYLKLNNKLRNDRKEEKFNFVVDESKYSSNLYLIKKINDLEIEVNSWDEVTEDSDVFLFQIYQAQVSNLKFISENSTDRKEIELTANDKLYTKIQATSLVENFTKNYIEYSLNNKIYQSLVKIEKQLNSFQKEYSWEEQLQQIKYIVNDKSWRELNKDSKMSNSERVEMFWASNKAKNSGRNELQEILYSRVLYADQKFSVHRYKKGWETDRGRIYIKFGPPDEISVDNNPAGSYPTQTWFYYTLNKTFLFYDRSRIEDYKLYNKEEEYGY